jgi:hypothetical protein
MVAHGEKLAEEHLKIAEQAKDQLAAANDRLEEVGRKRKKLGDEPVEGPTGRITRRQNRIQLGQNQQIESQRELAGHLEHRHAPGAGWLGHAVALVIAAIETAVTVRIFNVDLFHFTLLVFLPWLALTVALWIFNDHVTAYLGRRRRDARETREAATRLNTLALSQAHFPSGEPPPWGQAAGLAPSAAQVKAADRSRNVALSVWGIPLVCLLVGMYWRLASSASPLALGTFTWIFPAAVVAVMAALLWALVVEPNSLGNTLGDHLRAGRTIDAESTGKDEILIAEGRHAYIEGREYADVAHVALLEADEQITEALKVTHRGLQIAHTTLGLADVGEIRGTNLLSPSMPHRGRIHGNVVTELERQETLAKDLELDPDVLGVLDPLGSPHAIYAAPPKMPPEREFVDPAAMPAYPESTLSINDNPEDGANHPNAKRRHRLRWGLISVLAIALLVLTLAGFLIGKSVSAQASSAAPFSPSSSTVAGPNPTPSGSLSGTAALTPASPPVHYGIRLVTTEYAECCP